MKLFNPTRAQSKAKATFHKRYESNPILGEMSALSRSQIQRLSGVVKMDAWFKQDGFEEWFFDNNYNKELLESAVELGIHEVINILEAPSDGERGSPKPSDKIAALKLVLEYAGYNAAKETKVEYQDKEIANMDEENLDKMISQSLKSQRKVTEDLEVAFMEKRK